jgi:hypothetical protein
MESLHGSSVGELGATRSHSGKQADKATCIHGLHHPLSIYVDPCFHGLE